MDSSLTGSLHLYIGPMYSGKTSKLISNYDEVDSFGIEQIVIDYDEKLNNGYKLDNLYNHDNKTVQCYKTTDIYNIYNIPNFSNIKIIHINEGQFFKDLYNTIIQLVEYYNKTVYIYALDGDFNRDKFGDILDLIRICDTVIKLNGKCKICNKPSLFSHRLNHSNQQIEFNDDKQPSYIPLCRKCYLKKILENPR